MKCKRETVHRDSPRYAKVIDDIHFAAAVRNCILICLHLFNDTGASSPHLPTLYP
jgi:hypothetical protein